jgi:hypothetical protein
MSAKTKMCSPVEMRKNLILVDALRKSGMDFVAIPVLSDEHKEELLKQVKTNLSKIEGNL